MNITVGGILMTLVFAYLAMAFVKFMLMFSSAHVAAGVHVKMAQRSGFRPSFFRCYLALFATIVPICLIGWPKALFEERFRFFRAYTRREVIKDIVHDYRYLALNK